MSAATVAVLIALAATIRGDDWPVGVALWLALAWSALPFLHLSLPHPVHVRAAPEEPGLVTTVMLIRDEPADVARASIAAAAATGPTVVVALDESVVATHVPSGVQVVVRDNIEDALVATTALVDTEAVQLLSAGSFPVTGAANRASGLFRDPAVGWVIGLALPFNRDGYAPTARWRLQQRLRRVAAARHADLWEPDAMIVRTDLLRAEALRHASPVADTVRHRSGGWWLRSWRAQGYGGALVNDVVAVWTVPVDHRWYWKRAVLRSRERAADLADAGRWSAPRGGRFCRSLLARELYAWSLCLLLLSPVLMRYPHEFPFDLPELVVLAMVAATGAMRWAALRWAHDVPLHPLRDVLAATYGAPASALATGAAISRRTRPTRVPLPPRPLAWAAILFALAMVVSITSTTTPNRTTVLTMALTELVLLWLFAMQGVHQLLDARTTYRLPADLAVDIGTQRSRTAFVSPNGFGLRDPVAPLPIGSLVTATVQLDDGHPLRAAMVVSRDERTEGAVAYEFVAPEAAGETWAAQVGRTAIAAAGMPRTGAIRRSRPRRLVTRRRLVGDLTTLAIATLAVVAAAVLLLLVFDYQPRIIRSGSMEPALHVGDIALVQQIPASELEVGEIATIDLARDGGTTHRVRSIVRDGDELVIETQGDAFPTGEQWRLHEDDVVGRVEARLPYAGAPLAWLASSPVRPHLARLAFAVALAAIAWGWAARHRARVAQPA